jgi:hypothetical protein
VAPVEGRHSAATLEGCGGYDQIKLTLEVEIAFFAADYNAGIHHYFHLSWGSSRALRAA